MLSLKETIEILGAGKVEESDIKSLNPLEMTMMTNIRFVIFIDIDGVLINDGFNQNGLTQFNPELVENLNILTNKLNANLVVSSSWKHEYTLKELKKIFKRNGVFARVIDVTPNLEPGQRGEEIYNWLTEHEQFISYLVIDDDVWDIPEWIPEHRFVQVNSMKGLDNICRCS